MEREGIIFYRSWFESITDNIDDPADQGKVVLAIIDYALNGNDCAVPRGAAGIAFSLAKKTIDSNNEKYLNGKRGGRPKKQ